jgi:hypothetical protein
MKSGTKLNRIFLRVKVWRGVKKNVSEKFNKEETLTSWTVTLCSKELDTTESFLR